MDTARTARRLGARDVTVVYRRSRAEMPAHHVEADDTEKEGVGFVFQAAPARGARRRQRRGRAACAAAGWRPARPDASGRTPPGARRRQRVRHRLRRDHRRHRHGPRHRRLRGRGRGRRQRGRVAVDPETLQSATPWLFAAGDVVSGASDITRATGPGPAGRPHDRPLDPAASRSTGFDLRLPVVDKAAGPGPPEDLPRWRCRPSPSEVLSAGPDRLPRGRAADDRGGGPPRRRPVPRLRRLLRVRRVRRCLPGRRASTCAPATRSCDVEVGAVVVATGLQALRRRPQAASTASAPSRTSSPACRWTACSPRPGRSTRSCGPATARSPSGSPTSCAPARATRRSATRSARASAACTRSSRTS